MKRFFAIGGIFLILIPTVIGVIHPSPAAAAMEFDRHVNIRKRKKVTNTPNRFLYTHPAYNTRRPVRLPCVPNGLARCLNPKPKKKFNQSRYTNRKRVQKVHPYIRHRYPIKVQQNF